MHNFSLLPNELHIYKLRWNDIPADLLAALLSFDEQQRMEKYKFHADKMRFCIGRGALRLLAARYLNVTPQSLEIKVNDYGKPLFQPPYDKLFFNISHSGDWVLLAFAWHEVGIDVQTKKRRPTFDFKNIAKHAFHADEIALASSDINKFYDIWCSKEAVVKALGVGLYGQLQQLSVLPALEIGKWSNIVFNTQHLQIGKFSVDDSHAGAIAVMGNQPITIKFFGLADCHFL